MTCVHGQMKDEVLLNMELCGSHRTDTLHIYDDLIDYDVMWPIKAIIVHNGTHKHMGECGSG